MFGCKSHINYLHSEKVSNQRLEKFESPMHSYVNQMTIATRKSPVSLFAKSKLEVAIAFFTRRFTFHYMCFTSLSSCATSWCFRFKQSFSLTLTKVNVCRKETQSQQVFNSALSIPIFRSRLLARMQCVNV